MSVKNYTPFVFCQAASDRRNWQHGSGLMPVFEEDEENGDSLGEEGGDPTGETDTEVKTLPVVL